MICSFISAFIIGLVLNIIFVPLGGKASFLKSRVNGGYGVSKLGGIAIFASFLTAFFAAAKAGLLDIRSTGILSALALMFLLGLTDDFLNLSPLVKLSGQALVAGILLLAGVKTQIAVLPAWANVLLTLLWMVAMTNAFNLLDILDGLAAGIGVICYLTFWYIAGLTGNLLAGILSAGLLGANLAFLKFNFRPAKLYMGDSGSLLNGFSLAAIAIILSYAPAGRETALFAPLLILALLWYDLLFVIVMRLLAKRPITQKSRDHFALRLIFKGVSTERAVVFMYALNCLFNLAAVFLVRASRPWGFFILSLAVLSWLFIAYEISRIKIYETQK